MVSVIGARGGVGASTVVSSLAYLTSKDKRQTALLDLDVHFGTGALSLDLEPGAAGPSAVENPSRIDGLFIERKDHGTRQRDAGYPVGRGADRPAASHRWIGYFPQLEEELRAAFECTFVDLPRNMLVQHPHLILQILVGRACNRVRLASARDTIRILSWLKRPCAAEARS